jgi:hypothetical protein
LCADDNDKNGKQVKLKEFPDEKQTTKYRQELRRTDNFNQGNQDELKDIESKPLSPEETEFKKLDDAESLEDAYKAKERRTKMKEHPVIPDESME